jgi:hypothetical protein
MIHNVNHYVINTEDSKQSRDKIIDEVFNIFTCKSKLKPKNTRSLHKTKKV